MATSSSGSAASSPRSEIDKSRNQIENELQNDAEAAHPDDGSDDLDEDEAGLFGSGSENEGPRAKRKLDDEQLDSGDDMERNDRLAHEDGDLSEEEHTQMVADISIGRHTLPQSGDGELYLLRFPESIGIDATAFEPTAFEVSQTEHHSSATPSTTFSAAQTSRSTIRWRHSSSKARKLQSNARIVRWSDGSLTLQLASMPMEQLQLDAKALAPPQTDPRIPTPTSRKRKADGDDGYNARLESHTYLAAVHAASRVVQITNHVTAALNVRSTLDENDDALLRLQESMAAAIKGNKASTEGVPLINLSEDPELAKKKAEIAEREKLRAQRRRQTQEEREGNRRSGMSGRLGHRSGALAGLSVGALETDGSGKSKAAGARKPRRRRNSEYSDEEEEYGGGRGAKGREDEYDEDDGFLVGSDEEPELVEDDDGDDEESVLAESDDHAPKRGKEKEAADGAARLKHRKVVSDDEDE